MNIIAGSSNPQLAQAIFLALKKKVPEITSQYIDLEITKFANDEKRIWLKNEKQVRGRKVCLVQSFSQPVDENLIETLLIIDALERLGAKEVSLIIPWLGYSLQDKVFRPGEAIAAKVVADMLSNSFVSRVFLLDLHNPSIPGFFSVPTYHLSADQLFVDYLQTAGYLNNAVVVSPDFGGLKRARHLASTLQLPLLNIDKSRDLATGAVTAHALHGGKIAGKNALLFDDVIVSGGTAVSIANLLKQEGAKQVIFTATHGIFCNDGLRKIAQSQLDQVIISNSIAQSTLTDKIKQIDLSALFVNALLDWI